MKKTLVTMLLSSLLLANQPVFSHTKSVQKTPLARDFIKLRQLMLRYEKNKNNKELIRQIKRQKNLINARGTLLIIAKTGGREYLFELFENDLKKGNFTFEELGVMSAEQYKKLKSAFFKKINNRKTNQY